jgi:leucyl-tRNA synthetase
MTEQHVEIAERPKYEPAVVEPKWQAYWDEHQTFKSERHAGKPKIYILDMFPYPSGAGLHVGHPEGYTATDIVARFKRMNGFDVLHPMGWDAFGLPAEQHAIRTGTHPRATTAANILTFKRQLKSLGFSYDWSREIDTTDPKYVKWTQWIFLQFFKKGLAFQQSDRPVNWCPELGTVLANDEVTADGKSEVGGFPVEKLKIRQWSLAITKYADRLLADLAQLDWPETRAKQAHWIGRSEGANVEFAIKGHAEKITVFTTRVDTLPGATYVVLAPEHALAQKIATPDLVAEVKRYADEANAKTDIVRSDTTREKTGVPTGAFAVNPLNGDEIPIWVGDYVIGSYGSGAVMAVPAHDERDHAFALKYELPIVQVVSPVDGHAIDVQKEAFTDDGIVNETAILTEGNPSHAEKSKAPLPKGTTSERARRIVTDWLASNNAGCSKVTYKLRDWVFSRQRYWGEPIPIYFPIDFPSGKQADPRSSAEYTIRYDQPIAVDESELPLTLPDLEDFKPGTDPAGPLARAKDWRFFQRDGKWFARETNTMPQWAGSCWYYLRFTDPHNDQQAWSAKAYADWMPVDLYVGGSEHTVLHLLYARFWQKVLFDLGLVKDVEPFTKLVHQGLILGEDAQKMSKSRGNVVNPDDVIKKNGADALRLYEMFMGPLEAVKPWQTSGIEGVRRFLDRLWNVCENVSDTPPDDETKRLLHKTIQKVTGDIEAMRFNTAISAMMILVKHLGQLKSTPRSVAEAFVLIASPFAPHIGEELWQKLGHQKSLAYEKWPMFDAALVKDDVVEIGVQVNGKVRGAISIAVDANQETALAAAHAQEKVAQMIAGKPVAKVIYVPGKILNIIVKG